MAIAVPLLAGTIGSKTGGYLLTTFEQVMIGFAVYTIIVLTRIAAGTTRLVGIERKELAARNLRRSIDTKLEEIRQSYFAIVERVDYDKNFPAQYFERIVSNIQDRIYNAATKEEVRVDELAFTCTELVCKAVAAKGGQTLRLVYPLRDKEFVFDTWSRGYYRNLVRMVAAQQVAEIRRLFIYESQADLTDPNFARLFDFHVRGPGFSCKLLSRTDWEKLERDLRIPDGGSDFGVWGDLLVYRAVAARPDHIEGLYSAQPRTIRQYTEFFDYGWHHAQEPTPPTAKEPMTLYQLFEGSTPPAHLMPSEKAIWKNSPVPLLSPRFKKAKRPSSTQTPQTPAATDAPPATIDGTEVVGQPHVIATQASTSATTTEGDRANG